MTDLYLSVVFMLGLCLAAIASGAHVARRYRGRILLIVQCATALAIFAYFRCFWERPLLVHVIPLPSIIVLGNWLPLIGCFCVGMCVGTPTVLLWRRTALCGITCGLAAWSLISPIPGDPPLCLPLKPGRALQFQTSDISCSPAAAASLLRLHGIPASETEMSRLCLTRDGGTRWLGVYRGLVLKTQGTGWKVEAEDLQKVLAESGPGAVPGVLALSFVSNRETQTLAAGFQQNAGHSVVLLEYTSDGALSVFDPSPEFGFERWRSGFLRDIRRGILLRLVPEDPNHPPDFDAEIAVRREYAGRQIVAR